MEVDTQSNYKYVQELSKKFQTIFTLLISSLVKEVVKERQMILREIYNSRGHCNHQASALKQEPTITQVRQL